MSLCEVVRLRRVVSASPRFPLRSSHYFAQRATLPRQRRQYFPQGHYCSLCEPSPRQRLHYRCSATFFTNFVPNGCWQGVPAKMSVDLHFAKWCVGAPCHLSIGIIAVANNKTFLGCNAHALGYDTHEFGGWFESAQFGSGDDPVK